ncbi:hypothetical protein CHH28_09195 [Bacterioplanes sanyensis]|uniref:DUF4266 domain-containing protein n=1 Tax=Bacterioplanes sanyensis TaxID=1249553 RepID=A0A222FIH9_9GAMM|nr:DUF4266 domain-containing protein [Bacterioplanes sanyensis]ASP38845.1 hypothetical protein CHH28_09195 [Bacterioplanes sanyensis]
MNAGVWLMLLLLLSTSAVADIRVVYVAPSDSPRLTAPTLPPLASMSLLENAQLPAPSGWSSYESWLGIEPVKPWQKAILAEPEMKPAGRLPAVAKFNQKVFASKENTRGGTGIGGGGCGCN